MRQNPACEVLVRGQNEKCMAAFCLPPCEDAKLFTPTRPSRESEVQSGGFIAHQGEIELTLCGANLACPAILRCSRFPSLSTRHGRWAIPAASPSIGRYRIGTAGRAPFQPPRPRRLPAWDWWENLACCGLFGHKNLESVRKNWAVCFDAKQITGGSSARV